MGRLHADTLGPPAGGVAVTAGPALSVARAGLWTLLAAHFVTVWGTQWTFAGTC
jgi:hypothetical protein